MRRQENTGYVRTRFTGRAAIQVSAVVVNNNHNSMNAKRGIECIRTYPVLSWLLIL
jgi:hypothetical protein